MHQAIWLRVLRLPLTGYVTSQKSLSCSKRQFPRICKEKGTFLGLRRLNPSKSLEGCNNTWDSENTYSSNPQLIWRMPSVLETPSEIHRYQFLLIVVEVMESQ